MLVLTRKRGQGIVFPIQDVTVTILEVRGRSVRLGISGRRNAKVYRYEVWQRLQEELLQQSELENEPALSVAAVAMPGLSGAMLAPQCH